VSIYANYVFELGQFSLDKALNQWTICSYPPLINSDWRTNEQTVPIGSARAWLC